MKFVAYRTVIMMLTVAGGLAISTGANQQRNNPPESVKGYLRDATCPLRYKQSMKPQGSCAMDCVKAGSPLVVLTKEGVLYFPISETNPPKDMRMLLMPFFGKYVKVTGEVFERGGTHAISVETISEIPETD
ncbi:MAG: hypothetical protein WB660_15090 [Candidatus Sulfotelmatobacter sp.]